MPKAEERQTKLWREVLTLFNGKTITAGDVAKRLEISYASASNCLKQLSAWGHVRVVSFQNPESGHGRRRKVFELTLHGKGALKYQNQSK